VSGGARKAGPAGRRPAKRTASKKGSARGKGRKPVSPRRRRLVFLAKWGALVGLLLALVGVVAFIVLYRSTDIPDPDKDFQAQTSFVYYSDDGAVDGKNTRGEEIGRYAVQNRDSIPYDEMPDAVKNAVVAAENRSFWTDSGVDPKGILRALFNNASGNDRQGASTITQQYVKILYLSTEQTYTRKVKEAIIATKLSRRDSKEEILEGYLNTIYFGRGAYGVQAAAQTFFGKDAKDLDLRESAVLACVINNPSRFDPANGRDARLNLKDRYAYVLDGMAQAGDIEPEEAERAARKLPKFQDEQVDDSLSGQTGHMLTMVRKELARLTNTQTGEPFTDEEINGGGLRITTTFTDQAMQAAEDGFTEARPEGFSVKQLHVGIASVEVGTGAVRGFWGGQDYLTSQLNWAVSGGQAGSSLKPFALAAGIRQGFALKDTFEGNSPIEVGDSEFENQGDQDYGSAVSLTKATEDSINTAYIDLTTAMDNGPEAVVKQANLMGIPPELPKSGEPKDATFGFPNNTPGLRPEVGVALGSATVSPINMANAYATIANGGRAVRPYIIERVTNADGEELYAHSVSDRMAMNEDIASDVSYALQQVVTSGSGTAAQGIDRPAAGKTGTSTNSVGDVVSAWFTGYTPQMATSVVYLRGNGVGKLDGWLPEYFGGAYPADTWTAVMSRAMEGLEVEDFPEPAFVDGDAPSDGHEPAPPPPPPPTKTPKPTPSETVSEPSEEPSSEAPPPSPTPTPEPTPTPSEQPCGVLVPCETPSPTPTPTQTPSGEPSQTPAPRQYAVARRSWWMLSW
jgi:membrane peptidoglycan carboxypeptidase